AVYFSRYASKVTILVRADSLAKSMSHYLIEQIEALPNVEVLTNTRAVEAHGEDGHLKSLDIVTKGDDARRSLRADACFVFIGAVPRTDWLDGVVQRDERGFILAGPDLSEDQWTAIDRDPHLLETSVPGVFVAGDVRSRSMKRVASAVGEGSMVVSFVHQYLVDA
ncbi:MAG: NAD(P)/FAD-dependent oxidoreductase, partial [Solirubrobacteraceae bacterium]